MYFYKKAIWSFEEYDLQLLSLKVIMFISLSTKGLKINKNCIFFEQK